jgi:CRP/FNR family transcriptional regulator, cyclic AMP receptor protein
MSTVSTSCPASPDKASSALASIEIFDGLDAATVAQIAQRCTWRTYHPEQQIVGQQDETREVHFILSGRVRVNLYSPDGRDVTFRDLGPSNMFGELAALDEAPRSANVVALLPTTTASLKWDQFSQVLRDHPEVAAATLRRLVRLVRALSDRVYEFSTLAVRNRIHAELLRLGRDGTISGNTARIDPAPTHADIASRIATHREAVTRELGELTRARLVERDGAALVIRDVAKLARLVETVVES